MMSTRLHRSIEEPVRQQLSYTEMWDGPDRGLIWCWERGRQKQIEEPELAEWARAGELVSLGWKRGTLKAPSERPTSNDEYGALQYLAEWQGLRGEDLDLPLEGETEIVCTTSGKRAVFKAVGRRSGGR